MPDDTVPTTPYERDRQRFSNWSRWGDDDQLGTLNHITDDVRRAAAALVREGKAISLSRPVATAGVLSENRNPQPADHRMNVKETSSGDYIGVSYHGFANTHVDALCHIFTDDGRLYGGRSQAEVTDGGARALGVEHLHDGIVTRGVLYDVPRHRGTGHVTLDEPVYGAELEAIAAATGVESRAGDAVLVRMGASSFWAANPDFGPARAGPGLHASAMEFLYDHDAALLVWDLLEASGQDDYGGPSLPIHSVAIPYMGLTLVDNADLDPLAEACAARRRWECMLTVAPLVVVGGTGSPVNPIALL
jgi:kynurenine formamidase